MRIEAVPLQGKVKKVIKGKISKNGKLVIAGLEPNQRYEIRVFSPNHLYWVRIINSGNRERKFITVFLTNNYTLVGMIRNMANKKLITNTKGFKITPTIITLRKPVPVTMKGKFSKGSYILRGLKVNKRYFIELTAPGWTKFQVGFKAQGNSGKQKLNIKLKRK